MAGEIPPDGVINALAEFARIARRERKEAEEMNQAPMPGSELGEAAFVIATGWTVAKLRETGVNRGAQVDKIQSIWGLQGEPWCSMFVHYCLLKALAEHLELPQTVATWRSLLPVFRKVYWEPSPSCTAVMQSAKKRQIWVPWKQGEGAEPGDPILFNWKGQKSVAQHIGLYGGGNVTLEANTAPGDGGSQSDGQGVFQRVRPDKVILGTVALHRIV